MYEFKFIRKNIEQLKEMEKKMNKKSWNKINGCKLKTDKFSLEIRHIFQQRERQVRKRGYKGK